MILRLAKSILQRVRMLARAIQHNARNAFANACNPAPVCVMQRRIYPPPPA